MTLLVPPTLRGSWLCPRLSFSLDDQPPRGPEYVLLPLDFWCLDLEDAW